MCVCVCVSIASHSLVLPKMCAERENNCFHHGTEGSRANDQRRAKRKEKESKRTTNWTSWTKRREKLCPYHTINTQRFFLATWVWAHMRARARVCLCVRWWNACVNWRFLLRNRNLCRSMTDRKYEWKRLTKRFVSHCCMYLLNIANYIYAISLCRSFCSVFPVDVFWWHDKRQIAAEHLYNR